MQSKLMRRPIRRKRQPLPSPKNATPLTRSGPIQNSAARGIAEPAWAQRLREAAKQWGGWIVATVTLVVRLVHWGYVRARDPLYAFTLPETDMHTYWEWAKSIAQGDWLSTKQGVFYYGPLYPYWLAFWFKCFGPNYDLVHGLQVAVGLVAPLAIWDLARRLFGPREGLVAGLLVAAAAPILFYEQLLLMEGLLVAIHAGFLWCVARVLMNGERRSSVALWSAVAGLLAGLACLGRGNFQLVAAAFIPFWYVAARWGKEGVPAAKESAAPLDRNQEGAASPRSSAEPLHLRPWIATGAYAAALALILGASLLRNGLVGGQWVLTTSNGPILLYIGNAPDSMGIFHYPDSFFALETKYGGDRGAVPWARELLAAAAQDPLAFANGLLRKVRIFFSGYEVADNANFYLLDRMSPVVHYNPLRWEVIVGLGLVGAWLARGSWRRQLFLYLYAAVFALSIIVVFVVGRYRLEFLLPMAVWGSVTVCRLLDLAGQRVWSRFATLLAISAASILALAPAWSPAIALNAPPNFPELRPIRPNDYSLLARAYLETQKYEKAKETLTEGFAQHPWDQTVARQLSFLLEKEGQMERAAEVLRRHLAIMPGDLEAARELARVLARSGRTEESLRILEQIIQIAPSDTRARELLNQVKTAQPVSSP